MRSVVSHFIPDTGETVYQFEPHPGFPGVTTVKTSGAADLPALTLAVAARLYERKENRTPEDDAVLHAVNNALTVAATPKKADGGKKGKPSGPHTVNDPLKEDAGAEGT